MTCLSASAAEVILTTMAITAKNGDVVELQFIDEPIATFTDENVTFTDINEHTLVYPMADVEKSHSSRQPIRQSKRSPTTQPPVSAFS